MLKAYNCTTLYSTCTTQMSVVHTWKVQAKKTYPHPQHSHIIIIIIIIIINIIIIIIIINILIAVPVIAHHDIVVLPVLWPFTFWPSSGFLDQTPFRPSISSFSRFGNACVSWHCSTHLRSKFWCVYMVRHGFLLLGLGGSRGDLGRIMGGFGGNLG